MQNKLRIIGGQWRSRHINFTDVPGLRPTPGRVRETLFNWLQYDIVGKHCLDLYAGSGALGFEAASRGAKQVVLAESNPTACLALKHNIGTLAAHQIRVVQSDVIHFLQGAAESFDVVFMDPPFGKSMVADTCHMLETHGWLATAAKIYVETEAKLSLEGLPTNWQALKHKTAGDVAYHLFERQQPSPPLTANPPFGQTWIN